MFILSWCVDFGEECAKIRGFGNVEASASILGRKARMELPVGRLDDGLRRGRGHAASRRRRRQTAPAASKTTF